MNQDKTVLIAGASGLVGNAALERFLNEGWNVIAISRRIPKVDSSRPFRHISLDLTDEETCKKIFSSPYGCRICRLCSFVRKTRCFIRRLV